MMCPEDEICIDDQVMAATLPKAEWIAQGYIQLSRLPQNSIFDLTLSDMPRAIIKIN